MSGKTERILESIKLNLGDGTYQKIIEAQGEPPLKSTPSKQARYVKAILSQLENENGKEEVKKIMQPCGHECISNKTIDEARKLFKGAANMEEFLSLLNEKHIGGGRLHISSGKIVGIYEKCYCGMAKAVKDMPSSYCNCSAGWFERLFSLILDKPVKVSKVKTILDGADSCVFEIEF